MLGIFQPIFGALVILGIAIAFSTNRRAINWTTVAWGLSLQVLFAIIVLKTTVGQRVFSTLGDGINRLLGFAGVGAAFVFGPLGDSGIWGKAMTNVFGPALAAGAAVVAGAGGCGFSLHPSATTRAARHHERAARSRIHAIQIPAAARSK